MRKALETLGFVLAVLGLAGLVNHWWSDFRLLNVMNGFLLPWLGLSAYSLYLNLIVLVLGLAVMLAADAFVKTA